MKGQDVALTSTQSAVKGNHFNESVSSLTGGVRQDPDSCSHTSYQGNPETTAGSPSRPPQILHLEEFEHQTFFLYNF